MEHANDICRLAVRTCGGRSIMKRFTNSHAMCCASEALPPFRMTVRGTLSVTALGYDYAVASASTQPPSP